jgi:hypothetical protein
MGHRDMLIDLGNAGRGEKEFRDLLLVFYNRLLQMLNIQGE